jgi:hypothetical protein
MRVINVNTLKIMKKNILSIVFFSSAFLSYSQDSLDTPNYYEIIINKYFSDSGFLNRFITDHNGQEGVGEIFIAVPNNYLFKANKIAGYNVVVVSDKEKLCQGLSIGDKRTVIVASHISIIDSLNEFTIPIACFEIQKTKKECLWKVFLGGTLLDNENNIYSFVFDFALKKWVIK